MIWNAWGGSVMVVSHFFKEHKNTPNLSNFWNRVKKFPNHYLISSSLYQRLHILDIFEICLWSKDWQPSLLDVYRLFFGGEKKKQREKKKKKAKNEGDGGGSSDGCGTSAEYCEEGRGNIVLFVFVAFNLFFIITFFFLFYPLTL